MDIPESVLQVQKDLQQEGYQIKDFGEYKKIKQEVFIICPKGHNFSMTWDSLRDGHRCKFCAWEKKVTSREEIISSLQKEGYTLSSCDFTKPNKVKLETLCPKGHVWKFLWYQWKQLGHRCKECFLIDKKRLSPKAASKVFEAEGYTLLSDYKRRSDKIDLLCPQGHDLKMSRADFLWGARCRLCSIEGNRLYTLEDVEIAFQNEGYTLLNKPGKYLRHSQEFEYSCPKGHQGKIVWNSWHQGHRCGACIHLQSVSELEIVELYKDLNPKTKDRIIVAPKELDLYFPIQKVAIEYCGLYWHSDAQERMTPGYHRDKLDKCNEQNIRLLTIFEDEWLNNKEICTSRINSALGIVQNKVFARKCLVRQIPNKEAYEFLKRTHLQGPGTCKIAYGLFYNNQLIQVMTFGSPARAHTSKGRKVLEMKRLAGELNTIIVGGASKLFKLGLDYAKQNSFEVIKSYCDLRWGTGNLYAKLGFTKAYETKYTPHYTDFKNRFRNQNLAQNKKKTGKTEFEVAQEKGLWKIYDCGHQTWEYKIR